MIGLLIIATNDYVDFLQPLLESADKYFLNNKDVTYFIFTNREVELTSSRNVVVTKVEHRQWPWMTLGRYKIFSDNQELFSDMDYLFYCDSDMLFVGDVGEEILSERVATIHPGFKGGRGTPETNPDSSAYIRPDEPMIYFAGGFNGGTKEEYLRMSNTISVNINDDYRKGLIAVWHDESHMNRYFVNFRPTKILDYDYCCPETWKKDRSKLLALDKNHEEIRR